VGLDRLSGSWSNSTMTSIATSILAAVRRLWSCLAPLRDRAEPLQVVADFCHRPDVNSSSKTPLSVTSSACSGEPASVHLWG
jgi:hypothetical protein